MPRTFNCRCCTACASIGSRAKATATSWTPARITSRQTHVVVAMASYQGRKVPAFAKELSPEIVQLHSCEYKSLSQLKPGGVLIVGTANSGAEIAMETALTRIRRGLRAATSAQMPFQHQELLGPAHRAAASCSASSFTASSRSERRWGARCEGRCSAPACRGSGSGGPIWTARACVGSTKSPA